MFGKLVHLGIDALLISAFLAGIKRNTGLTWAFDVFNCAAEDSEAYCSYNRPALHQVPNKDIRREYEGALIC